MTGFMSTCISILWTWTGRAKKLDEVQLFIPPGWKQRMVRNHEPWRGKQNTVRGDRRHRHKLRETWKNVPESKMKELSKAASLYQSLPQGNSYNTVVGCWFVNDAVSSQEWKFPSQQLQAFSHLNWIHKPHKPIRKCKSSVGTSSNLNNLDPLLVLWFQTSRTSQINFSTIFSGRQIGQIHVIFKSDQAQWHSSWSSFLTESKVFWTFRLFSPNFRHFSRRFRRIQS